MSLPTLTVRVAWATGPYDVPSWTDITSYVLALSIRRGRQNELNQIQPGTLVLELDNRDRRFDPTYASGAYYPNVLPTKRVNVRATWSAVTYDLFTGYIDSMPRRRQDFGLGTVSLSATDGFEALSLSTIGFQTSGVNYSQELSGTRINNALNSVGWPAADRSIGAGQSQMQAITLTGTTALQHILKVAESENGLVFMRGDGAVTFQDRYYRILNQGTSLATFGNGAGELPYVGALVLDYDVTHIYNDVRFSRAGGPEQAVADAASQLLHFTRKYQRTGQLMTTDRETRDAALFWQSQYSAARTRVVSLPLEPQMDDALWPAALGYDLSSRITVVDRPVGGGSYTVDCHVEAVSHDYEFGKKWRTVWSLSPANPQSYLILDDPVYAVLDDIRARLAY